MQTPSSRVNIPQLVRTIKAHVSVSLTLFAIVFVCFLATIAPTKADDTTTDEAASHAKEQEQLRIYAEEVFSKLSFSPQVTLCSSLQRLNATVELRGKDIEVLKPLLEQKKYLELTNLLNHSKRAEYRNKSDIDCAITSLKWKQFKILLKTSYNPRRTEGNAVSSSEVWDLHYFLSTKDGIQIPSFVNTDWEAHPDGIGYLHSWQVGDGPSVILICKRQLVKPAVMAIRNDCDKQIELLEKKSELGELNETSFQEQKKAIQITSWEAFLKWAAGM